MTPSSPAWNVKPRNLILEVRERDHPEDEAIAWIFVEREEIYQRNSTDGRIQEASICLTYQRIVPKHSYGKQKISQFKGGYSDYRNEVSLTSTSMSQGAIFLDLPDLEGQRIGTYLMNEIVQWVKQWPDATVNSIELMAGQSHEENKARRNQFYEQFGLIFDYTDPDHKQGRSRPMPARELVTVEAWRQNITEHKTLDHLAEVLYAKQSTAAELRLCERVRDSLIKEQKEAYKKPLCWALIQLYHRYSQMLLPSLFITILACIL